MIEPDGVTGLGYAHWLAFDLPPDARGVAEGAGSPGGSLPGRAVQGCTDPSVSHCAGPCPLPGQERPHHCVTTVYALSVPGLKLDAGATLARLRAARGPQHPAGPMTRRHIARRLLAAVLCAALAARAEASVPDLEHYRWRSRVLLLFAPGPDDPALARQRAILAKAGAAASERDLVLLEVIGADRQDEALRRRFGAGADRFRAVLVGKDGGAKLSSAEPIPADRLFGVIDSMPMRRNEAAGRDPGTR